MSSPQLDVAISEDASSNDVAMTEHDFEADFCVLIDQATSSSSVMQPTIPNTRVIPLPIRSLSTISNAQVLINTAITSTNYMNFAKFAVEIQIMIWKATITPRLVHWRPGGGKPPSELLTNKQSHEVLKKEYAVFQFKAPRLNDKYTVYFKYELDILYRRQRFPNSIQVGTSGPQICYMRNSWSQPIRKLALDLGQAWGLCSSTKNGNGTSPNNLWFMLRLQFPVLEQLIVILKPSLKIDQTLEGLETVGLWNGSWSGQFSDEELEKMTELDGDLWGWTEGRLKTLGRTGDWGVDDRVLELRFVKVVSRDDDKSDDRGKLAI